MSVSTDSDFKWSAKRDWQTSVYRNHLCDHIRQGGTGDDLVGREIIDKFVGGVMLSSDFCELVEKHRFSRRDLRDIVSSTISAGLSGEIPSPFILDGFPRVLGCVLLEKRAAITAIMLKVSVIEAAKIDGVGSVAQSDSDLTDLVELGRRKVIEQATTIVAREHYHFISQKNGLPNIQIKFGGSGLPNSSVPGGGCGFASLIVLGGMGFCVFLFLHL